MGQRKGKRRGLRMPRECRSWYHDRTIPLCVKSRNQIVYLDAECSFVFKGCAPEPHDAQAQITSGGEGDVHLHAHGIASDFACKHAHRAMHLHNPSTFERLNLIRTHVLVTRGGTRGTARRPGDPAEEAPPREGSPRRPGDPARRPRRRSARSRQVVIRGVELKGAAGREQARVLDFGRSRARLGMPREEKSSS